MFRLSMAPVCSLDIFENKSPGILNRTNVHYVAGQFLEFGSYFPWHKLLDYTSDFLETSKLFTNIVFVDTY